MKVIQKLKKCHKNHKYEAESHYNGRAMHIYDVWFSLGFYWF